MEPAVSKGSSERIMKLHVQPGPLPIPPPYFDLEEEDIDLTENEEEIDLTDLFELPKPPKDVERTNPQAPRHSVPA